jgi:CheY-like chemotaxis protein
LDRSEGGLGIGLSVVQRLVQMHGGSISAASAGPNLGSTFQIWLPLIPPPAELPTASASSVIRPKRVLVVDDNIDAGTTLTEVLRFDGHIAEVVHTARSALERFPRFLPDVVLLDIGLPDMNGYEVAKELRALDDSVRLVALTGYGQEEDKLRTRAAGFDAHMVKPVDFAALERILA